MTDVTGVAIPPTFWMHFGKHSHSTGGFPRQCAHWLGMTGLLFVQLYFNETAPFLYVTDVGYRVLPLGPSTGRLSEKLGFVGVRSCARRRLGSPFGRAVSKAD